MTADGTQTLTTAIASGDPEAFASLYDEWFDRMYAEARRVTGRDESFCLDVVQDSMMKVIRSMRPITTRPQLHRWLMLVVRSCGYDRLRQDRRRTDREAAVSSEPTNTLASADDRLDWLRREIEALDNGDIDLLIMRHRFGWTLERIGRAVGLTASAVDGRIRRSLATLSGRATKEVLDD